MLGLKRGKISDMVYWSVFSRTCERNVNFCIYADNTTVCNYLQQTRIGVLFNHHTAGLYRQLRPGDARAGKEIT